MRAFARIAGLGLVASLVGCGARTGVDADDPGRGGRGPSSATSSGGGSAVGETSASSGTVGGDSSTGPTSGAGAAGGAGGASSSSASVTSASVGVSSSSSAQSSSSATGGPHLGPNLQRCICNDNVVLDSCLHILCSSSTEMDMICGPACSSHDGVLATGCIPHDPSCHTP